MQLAENVVVADRFRLVRLLGRGGMGSVWQATHLSLHTPCAVKFIDEKHAGSEELRARFEREARAAALLRSPNVVQILDHGTWEGVPYIAMEMLEGEDLRKRLETHVRLPPAEVWTIMEPVLRALSKAHAAGIVHRDLKPENIFLAKDDDRDVPKILDFGVAKLLDPGVDTKTRTGMLLGTPYYMSPEQANGAADLDARSDLWAIAVIVYECLVGARPFEGDTFAQLVLKITAAPLPIPSQAAVVPPGFDAWWDRAAQTNPAKRFQSAKELSEALRQVLVPSEAARVSAPPQSWAASPPTAPSPGAPSPMMATTSRPTVRSLDQPRASRAPLVLASLGVVAVLAIAGTAVVGWRMHASRADAAKESAAGAAASEAPSAAPPTIASATATPPAPEASAPASALATSHAPPPVPTHAGAPPPQPTPAPQPQPPAPATTTAATAATPPPAPAPAPSPTPGGRVGF